MQQSLTSPLSPADVQTYFRSHLPSEELPGPYFETASQSLLHGIAAFFTGTGSRPSSTLENIMATISYPNIAQVLAMLGTDPECAKSVLHLKSALTRQAVLQVAAVPYFIQIVLGHVHPAQQAQERVHSFISAFAA
jgi:hypothetical protein